MKVAHLVSSFSADPGSGDGPGDELVDLAAVAGPTGVEPVVVVLGSSGDRWDVDRLRRLKVPVVELGLAPWDPRAVGRTVRLLREHGVELLHTHERAADVVGALATRLPGGVPVPMVSTLYPGENLPTNPADRLRRTAKILLRRRIAARTIAISHLQRERYRRFSGTDRALVGGRRPRVRQAVGHHDEPAVRAGEAPVALPLQVRDRDRAGGHPPPQEDLRGAPQPVGGVGGEVLHRVEGRHERQRRPRWNSPGPEPRGQAADDVGGPAVRVDELDPVLVQHARRPAHRARVPGSQPELDDRDAEAAQPRDLPAITGRPEHDDDGLDPGAAGDGREVHELVARSVVLDEGGDEVGNLHGGGPPSITSG